MEPKCLPKFTQNQAKIHTFAPGLHFGASWLVLAPFWLNFRVIFNNCGSMFGRKSSILASFFLPNTFCRHPDRDRPPSSNSSEWGWRWGGGRWHPSAEGDPSLACAPYPPGMVRTFAVGNLDPHRASGTGACESLGKSLFLPVTLIHFISTLLRSR